MPPRPAVSTNLPFSEGQPFPLGERPQRLVGALQDALRADVDPGAGRHLPVHDQALGSQLIEMLLGGPMRHQVGIGDQHAWGVRVALENGHRFAGLHQQSLVIFQLAQRIQDGVKRLPVARRLPAPAIDDQLLRFLGDLGVQVVLDHAVSCFG